MSLITRWPVKLAVALWAAVVLAAWARLIWLRLSQVLFHLR